MESALVRCRVLDDFLCDSGLKPDTDIYANRDFGYQPTIEYQALPDDFRSTVNERSVHLTWSRTRDPLPDFQNIGVGVEKYVEYVLAEAFSFLEQVVQQPGGIQLVETRHQVYWQRLTELYAKLKPEPAPPPRAVP
jgi:hypothetical protein